MYWLRIISTTILFKLMICSSGPPPPGKFLYFFCKNMSWIQITLYQIKFLLAANKILSVEYKITTETKDVNAAGTVSDFYYKIIGTRGTTSEHITDNDGSDRNRGENDTYTITDRNRIGDFRCVSVRMDGGDGWWFTEVRLHYE